MKNSSSGRILITWDSAKVWEMTFFVAYVKERIHLPLTDGQFIKCVILKTFFVFHLNSMEIGEVVVVY